MPLFFSNDFGLLSRKSAAAPLDITHGHTHEHGRHFYVYDIHTFILEGPEKGTRRFEESCFGGDCERKGQV